MIIYLREDANDCGTYAIETTFKDEAGVLFQPKTLFWSLGNTNGLIMNDRLNVECSPDGSIFKIVLTGLDLEVVENIPLVTRAVVIEGTYDSENGNDLNFTQEIRFNINNIAKKLRIEP